MYAVRCGAALPGGATPGGGAGRRRTLLAAPRPAHARAAATGIAPMFRLAIQASIDEVVGGLAVWQRHIGEQLAHVAAGGAPPSED
ncbi:MAG: hypothetical protein KIS91_05230 [Anaerolineae bacterium]|nr:hypothetical protein [Anaerolineae bacterium]